MRRMPAPVTPTQPVVAAFDLDGTLTRRDSVGPFLARVAGWRLVAAVLRRPRTLARGLVRRDHDLLKALVCSSLAGVDEERIRSEGAAFAQTIVESRLRTDTAARLRRHQELGHAVVLVSASLEPYVEPLGDLLAVDDVLCTQLAIGSDGRLTGELRGPNCRGPEKERRLREWLHGREIDAPILWAYGDSAGDDALLAMADHPVRVDKAQLPADPVA